MKLIVSAPGKVILFGEHAVVYRHPAIAAAIGLHFTINVDTEVHPSNLLLIEMPNIDTKITTLNTDQIHLSSMDPETQSWNIVSSIFSHSDRHVLERSPCAQSVCVFVYIMLKIIQIRSLSIVRLGELITPKQSIRLRLDSNIPIGAGLGSSGAFTVAASTTLLMLTNTILISTNGVLNQDDRKLIATLAHSAESIIHGTSSGLDPTISTYGGIIVYNKSDVITFSRLDQVNCDAFQVLLMNSGINVPTRVVVDQVSNRYTTESELVNEIFSKIASIVRRSVACFNENEAEDYLHVLSPLIVENQQLLVQLGVSHPLVDELISELSEIGISAKLTGAGCGGSLFGLVSSDDQNNISHLLEKFHAKSIWFRMTPVSLDGVSIQLC